MHTDITDIMYDLYQPYRIRAALVTITMNDYNKQYEHITLIITLYNTEIQNITFCNILQSNRVNMGCIVSIAVIHA